MKNKFITLLYIALSLQAYTLIARNDSTSVIKNGIGLSITPMFSMPVYVNQNNYVNYTTKGSVGAMGALCQNIVLSKKQNFYLYTELGYLGSAYINTIPGAFYGNSNSVSLKFIERTNNGYFSLSLQKVLFHINKKFGLFAGVGAQISYCYSLTETVEQVTNTNGKTATNTQSTTSYDVPKHNQLAAAAIARIGFLINPTKHLSLNIAPVFYYGLNPKFVFKDNQPGYNSLGLTLQVMYNF